MSPRERYEYTAADHITWPEWLVFGVILLGLVLSVSLLVGIAAACVAFVIRVLKG